jgi:hypothetical protein
MHLKNKLYITIMSSDEEYESDEFIKSSSFAKKKNAIQKKRGRPKKVDAVQSKPVQFTTPENSENEDEEIILQLPISDDEDGEQSSSEKNLFTMKDESEVGHKTKTKTKSKSKIVESIENSSEGSNDSINIKQLSSELKKKDEIIKKLKDAMVNMRKNTYGHSDVCGNAKSRLINMKLANINKNNEAIVVDKTNIACWWCSHNFDSLPCFIPDRFCDGKYFVFGCFCTYSCAMAYNLNMNDYRVSIRVSLIKKLCSEIFGTANVPTAPPRELLTYFGGDMNIDEFRNQLVLHKKEFKAKIPPIIPLLMSVDENLRN